MDMRRFIFNLLFALACATITVLSPPAKAEYISAQGIHDTLLSDKKENRVAAEGYILGVHDTGQGVLFCTPNNLNARDMLQMVNQTVLEIPGQILKSFSADGLIVRILRAKWPCVQTIPNNLEEGSKLL